MAFYRHFYPMSARFLPLATLALLITLLSLPTVALAVPVEDGHGLTEESPLLQEDIKGLVPDLILNQRGLSRVWHTQAAVDANRSHVVGVSQYLSSDRVITEYIVKFDGGDVRFSAGQLNRYGEPIDDATAKAKANDYVKKVERLGGTAELIIQAAPECTLYVSTDRATLQAIDMHTGRSLWVSRAGSVAFPAFTPAANEKYVAHVNGSTLYLFEASTGKMLWSKLMRGAPSASPAITKSMVVVPMVNGTVEMYPLVDKGEEVLYYQGLGRALHPPVNTNNRLVWATKTGNLYINSQLSRDLSFRVEIHEEIVSAPGFSGNRVYLTSVDGYLYAVGELTGKTDWRFSTGEPIGQTPFTHQDAVYVVTDMGTLYKVNQELGDEVWKADKVEKVVAATKDRLYGLSLGGTHLLQFDLVSGNLVGKIPLNDVSLIHVNQETNRIILGTESGLIQCIKSLSDDPLSSLRPKG
ncbi:MAG: PQQ-like beta-propeller repeat protein [Pirellulaceae bacterium]|nr:PQQ-like beta-propeller repeat protein [Pirellulaceae bacterium]